MLTKTSNTDYATAWAAGGGLTLPLTQSLTFSPDTTHDIGASGASRPRSIYVGTSVVTPVLYGPSNVVEMRNATAAQTFRVYNTYTDPSNYARASISTDAGNHLRIASEGAGTGSGGNIRFVSGTHIEFLVSGTLRWTMQSGTGNFYTATDAAIDIGLPTSNRPRNIYQAGGTFQSYNPSAGIANDATNFERAVMRWNGPNFDIGTEQAGTGVARAMRFWTGGVLRWNMNASTGQLYPEADDATDLGGGALRIRSVYTSAGVHVWNVASLGTQQAGGMLTLLRPTAGPNAPGANRGSLYFRDGTTAGTLKLVVRAGTAGAEQTILDNIPQA